MIADDMAKFFVRISTDFDPLEYWSIRINNKASLSVLRRVLLLNLIILMDLTVLILWVNLNLVAKPIQK